MTTEPARRSVLPIVVRLAAASVFVLLTLIPLPATAGEWCGLTPCQASDPDPSYDPGPIHATYATPGPVVRVDHSHRNAFSLQACNVNCYEPCDAGDPCLAGRCIHGRLRGLQLLLEADGYTVEPLSEASAYDADACSTYWPVCDTSRCDFCAELEATHTLVISNAREAIGNDEAKLIASWVEEGGRLLLIADHEPFPCLIDALIDELGLTWHDEHVIMFNDVFCSGENSRCMPSDGDILEHPIVSGFDPDEQVNSVRTFGGSSLDLPGGGSGILSFPPRSDASGSYQGAALKVGAGRVFVSGEAAMFGTVHNGGGLTVADNQQFILNLMHWLDGSLPPKSCPQVVPPATGQYASTANTQARVCWQPDGEVHVCPPGETVHVTRYSCDEACLPSPQSWRCCPPGQCQP